MLFLKGKVNNKIVVDEIRKSDCLIMPSFLESFGMPVVEALINKKPVICSNNGALPEVTKNCALYFDPYSVDSIVKSIMYFKKNKIECEEAVKKWNLNYKKLFNLNIFQKHYNNIFFDN